MGRRRRGRGLLVGLGLSAGAFGTATGAISSVLGDAASVFEDVADSVIGGISSGFGLW